MGLYTDDVPAPFWNAERTQILRDLWPENSASTIAKRLDTSRNAIIGKAGRLKLGRKKVKLRPGPRPGERSSPGFTRPLRPRGGANTLHLKSKPPSHIPANTDDNLIPHNQRRQLQDLEPHHCRWPVNHPGEADFFYCGGDAHEHSYCEAHRGRGTIPTRPSIRALAWGWR